MSDQPAHPDHIIDAVARGICAEECAEYGEPPCWSTDGPWPNPECDEPGCQALARATLDAFRKAALMPPPKRD